jgi:hypothetical protein
MHNNTAQAYNLDGEYTSIYVVLNGYKQIIFYWSLNNDCQKRKPKWRDTKETIEEGMEIVSYNSLGCTVIVDGRRAEFSWTEYDRDVKNLRGPNHKGMLDNFGEWEFDPEFKINSPTANGNHYEGSYPGYYHEPQSYTDPFYMEE